jgi:Uma2 family endonuclease
MNAPHRLKMSSEEFLVWEARQERRHELVDGVVRMMAGSTTAHNAIIGNLVAALKQRLKGGPCRTFFIDIKVRTRELGYRYPDVVVDCAPGGPQELFAQQPTLLAEVLSDSTELLDEIEKLAEYQALAACHVIVFLSQRSAHARVWRRTSDGWVSADSRDDEAIALAHFGVSIPLAEIYDGIDFAAA